MKKQSAQMEKPVRMARRPVLLAGKALLEVDGGDG